VAPLCRSISQRSSPNTLRSLCMPQSETEKEWTPRARPDVLAGQQLPPAPQQERSRRKRDALLQSALALFAERGYEQTSIEDIAHQAGVAVGGFYQHFTSKRQILLVLMDRRSHPLSLLPTCWICFAGMDSGSYVCGLRRGTLSAQPIWREL